MLFRPLKNSAKTTATLHNKNQTTSGRDRRDRRHVDWPGWFLSSRCKARRRELRGKTWPDMARRNGDTAKRLCCSNGKKRLELLGDTPGEIRWLHHSKYFGVMVDDIYIYIDIRWGPPVINWFINPINCRYITDLTICHSYWTCKPT